MAGNLITLPLRVSFQSVRVLTRVAGGTTERALSLVGRTIGAVAPSPPTPSTTAPAPPPAASRERSETQAPRRKAPSVRAVSSLRTPTPEPETETVFQAREPEVSPPGAAEQTPMHVSEEPELVREVAESGAEDGAGAAITVAEPWNGYARMSAKDVIARARAGNPAELAAVRLYEARHRSRQTVLAAVDRQLKLAGGGAPA
ncbi:MAG TPA: hypothetical protein VME22_27250 [Solirubrobacteraceae bacterium]|nr:hypothetical protein [Solirubrobacteraceae bacterium]